VIVVSKATYVTARALYKLRGGIQDEGVLRCSWQTVTEGTEVTCGAKRPAA